MNDGFFRGFTHVGEAYYSGAILTGELADKVNFGIYHRDGGTLGECSVSWMSGLILLEAFAGSWPVLGKEMADVIALMSGMGKAVTPAEFCAGLIGLGFEDRTKRVDGGALP